MTMPHLTNCPHSGEGWCLNCVKELYEKTPIVYQQLASRTECNQSKSRDRMAGVKCLDPIEIDNNSPECQPIRLNHAVLGLTGEVGELAGAVERWIYYGKELDSVNIKEETGDCLWYLALLCNNMGFDMGEIMTANIAKLKQRYPAKYTDYHAAEENRDRAKERVALLYQQNELLQQIVGQKKESDNEWTAVVDNAVERQKPMVNNPTFEKWTVNKCEVCGVTATKGVHDISRDCLNQEIHWLCNAHDRPARILPNKASSGD